MTRTIPRAAAALLVAALAPEALTSPGGQTDWWALGPTRTIEFETDEGTWMSVDVSPDGRTLVFDLLGDIYTLPIEGGEATLIAGGPAWEHQPRYSPDGTFVAFASDRGGMMNLWLMRPDGQDRRQITHEDRQAISMPEWAPDGRSLIVRKHVHSPMGIELWRVAPEGGLGVRLTDRGKVRAPEGAALSPDGRFLYFSSKVGNEFSYYHEGFVSRHQLQRLDLDGGGVIRLTFAYGGGFRPAVSPDGRLLAYARREERGTALHLRDLETGADRVLVAPITRDNSVLSPQEGVLPGYAFTADGRSIVLSMRGELHRVDLADGRDRKIPLRVRVRQEVGELVRPKTRLDDERVQVRAIRWPTLSPDGRQLAFSALGKLWLMDLPAGTPRRLTSDSWREYAPAFSPDGSWIAYTTWSDLEGGGHLRLVSPDGRRRRQLTTTPRQYVNPAWSRDGSKLGFVVGSGGLDELQVEQDAAFDLELRWMPAAGGESRHVGHWRRPFGEVAHPELFFGPDGERLYYTEAAPDRETGPTAQHVTRTLVSSRLDGTDRRGHATYLPGDRVALSPDGRRLAIVRATGLYVVPVPDLMTAVDVGPEGTAALPVTVVTKNRVSFVRWLDDETLMWSQANRVSRARVGDGRVDGTQTVSEVNLTLPGARPEGRIAFRNARLVTLRGDEVIEQGVIVVDDNRIAAVGSVDGVSIPEGTPVVDVSGATIIPGLIDTHSHLYSRPHDTYPQQSWKHVITLAYGFTTTYEPSSPTAEIFDLRAMVASGELLGPRVLSSGDILEGRFLAWSVAPRIETLADAERVVRGYAAYGADVLKEYGQQRRDQRRFLATAARRSGVGITGEPNIDSVRRLSFVLDGFTSIEHSFTVAPSYDDVIQLVARSGTCHTPTLSIPDGGPGLLDHYTAERDYVSDPKVRRFTPEGLVDEYRRWRVVPESERYFLKQAAVANAIVKAGGCSTIGSHSVRVGPGNHWEMWARVDAGATPLDALRAATIQGAYKIGLEAELGSLEPGKLADFLVLQADPLADIRNTTRITYVVKNGFVYDAESMTELWPQRRRLDRFFWQTDDQFRRWAAPEPPTLARSRGTSRLISGGARLAPNGRDDTSSPLPRSGP
jgi:Tol biopolymer transport system component